MPQANCNFWQMLSTGPHIRGIIRNTIPRYSLEGQRQAMEQNGVTVVYEDDGKKPYSREAWIKSLRSGDVATVAWLGILVDRIGSTKARHRDLQSVMEEIEERGATIWELATGRRSSDKKERDAMVFDALEGLSRGRFDKGTSRLGRPPRFRSPEEKAIIWEEWHEKRHKNNAAAAIAASKRLKRNISANLMWKIIRDMRDESDEVAILAGGSGRQPGRRTGLPAIFDHHEPQVYFLQKEGTDQVKIGTTNRLNARMSMLRREAGTGLKLLGCLLGGREAEARLHQRFADYRIRGEWYRLEGKLAAFVAKLDVPKAPDTLR